MRFYHNIFYW